MIGRKDPIASLKEMLRLKKSEFLAVTGRRRVGKTYLIEEQFKSHFSLSVTGIQNGDQTKNRKKEFGKFSLRLRLIKFGPVTLLKTFA